jgi:hypothetical protein
VEDLTTHVQRGAGRGEPRGPKYCGDVDVVARRPEHAVEGVRWPSIVTNFH